jgi:hypothetical protein
MISRCQGIEEKRAFKKLEDTDSRCSKIIREIRIIRVYFALADFGILEIKARRTLLTDSGVLNTFETSGSSITTRRLDDARPAKRLGRALE